MITARIYGVHWWTNLEERGAGGTAFFIGSRPPELFFFCPVAAGFLFPEPSLLLLFVFWELVVLVFFVSGILNYHSFVYKMRIFLKNMSNTNLIQKSADILTHYIYYIIIYQFFQPQIILF